MSIQTGHPDARKVLIAGATGLVGGQILNAVLSDPSVTEVHALARRKLGVSHPKLTLHLVDFKALPALPTVDEVYLALGTTIKVAGSQEAFRAVDLAANLSVAKAALAAGAQKFGVVSAVGASSRSSVFYNRVKGELEDALKAMNPSALVIAQPSLLLDNREGLQQPMRIGEKIMIPIARLLAPITPGIYQPVHAHAVARALVATLPTANGVVTLASDVMKRIGR